MTPRSRALWALLLLVPAPTLGALAAFVWAPGALGQGLYSAAKLWILVLPLLWLLRVERGRPSLSRLPPERRTRALAEGLALGLLMSAAVLGVWWWRGEELVDRERLHAALAGAGLDSRAVFLAVALYITLVNSLLEEYVWRWFAWRQAEALVGGRLAVPLAALCFTLHHVVVFEVQLGARFALLGGLAVFVAGCLWSALYARWRSVWPCWVSHVLVDAAGLWIGWQLLF